MIGRSETSAEGSGQRQPAPAVGCRQQFLVAAGIGIGCLLIASMLWFAAIARAVSFHEVMITLFLFLTAPVSAQMIAKAYILRGRRIQAELPPTGAAAGWATLPQEKEPAEQNPRPA